MEWLKTLLEGKGISLDEDTMTEIKKELPKHFMPKGEYNLKLDEIKGLKEQISTRDNDILELKKAAKGNEELEKKYKDLQKKYTDDTTALNESLSKSKFNSAVELALSKSGAKSTQALKGLIDMEKVTYENDTVSGLDEQIEKIKTEHDYLFGTEPSRTGLKHGGTGSGGTETDFMSVVRENQVKRN